jgi:hypothetical protein
MCEADADGTGWKDLCGRGCYYDMNALLMDFESGAVAEPDERVVAYFSANIGGGGHSFDPDRIFTYILLRKRHGVGSVAAAGGAGMSAEWQALAAQAPAKAHSSLRAMGH